MNQDQRKSDFNLHLTSLRDGIEARERLTALGADPDGILAMVPKALHLNLKLENVPAGPARLLKKELLALGGEAAVSSGVYHRRDDKTDIIIMATADQLSRLAARISSEPVFSELSRALNRMLSDLERDRFPLPTPRGLVLLGPRPVIMGIVNCTPDSFYDGGRYNDASAAIERGLAMIDAGADIIDIGGESTRPGSDPVDEDEELRRVLPVVEALASRAIVSIDTMKPGVAKRAVAAGAAIINDVTGLGDPAMPAAVAQTGAAVIIMHILGTPKTMQQKIEYNDLFGDIIRFLRERIARAEAAGIDREKIVVDPGIGFGKTVGHNLELIRDLWRLRSLGRPILLGPSNKSFIGKVLGAEPDDRGPGTAAALVAGVLAGAHILRVHDPAFVKPFVDLAYAIRRGGQWNEAMEPNNQHGQ